MNHLRKTAALQGTRQVTEGDVAAPLRVNGFQCAISTHPAQVTWA